MVLPISIDAVQIELRRLHEEHVEAVVAAMALSLPELSVWFPWAQTPPDSALQRDRARRAVDAFENGRDFEFSLFETVSGELVGGFRINPLAAEDTAEFGYWIRSDRHRRGYATQAVRAARSAVFTYLPDIVEVQIHMDQANTASAGVASAAGFRFAGEIDRPAVAPGHTGKALVWATHRRAKIRDEDEREAGRTGLAVSAQVNDDR